MPIAAKKDPYAEPSYVSVCDTQLAHTLHTHTDYELVIVDSGSGRLCFGSAMDSFCEGDILFLSPTLSHSYHRETDADNASGRSMLLSPVLLSYGLLQLPASFLLQQLVDNSSRGLIFSDATLTRELSLLFRRLRSVAGVDQLPLIYKVLTLLCRCYSFRLVSLLPLKDGNRDIFDDDVIERVNRHIHIKFAERVTLDELATIAGLSKCAFCRTYKRRTQMTPFEYLANIRIQNAGRLLTLTAHTIGEVAYECGYPHISQFNKQFVKVMNVSPSEYRKLTKKGSL